MHPNVKTVAIATAIVVAMAVAPSLVKLREREARPGPAGIMEVMIGMPLQTFVRHAEPRPIPELTFKDGEGRSHTLSEFRGKTVLLNIWATWCSPCRREMPTLDRLQAMLGGPEFQVVALSIDRAGAGTVARFFGEVGIERLVLYVDETASAAGALDLYGLPGTLLIDGQGREIGRLLGPAEWDSAKMIEFLRARVAATPDVAVDR